MEEQNPVLRVQITQIDHTLVPSGTLDNTPLSKAPVVRIYGVSSTGRKCCLHVHQVYPYFFVEYSGDMEPNHVKRYIARLTRSLNYAIALSLKRNPESAKSQFVRAIILVKGVHFYGFHSSYSPFLKIHIVDPAYVNRAVTIMRSGIVMATRFHVFESHLSFVLQFLCDFGLYGCGWIELSKAWQRGQDENVTGSPPKSYATLPTSSYFRQGRMSLEVDAIAPHILNRLRLTARDLHHTLTVPTESVPQGPFVLSVQELWEDERRRRVEAGLSPSPSIPHETSESSRGQGGDWIAEARWWDDIRQRIEMEDFHSFISKEVEWERWVMTAFESVEALWRDIYKKWRPTRLESLGPSIVHAPEEYNPYGHAVGATQHIDTLAEEGNPVDPEVDETVLPGQALSTLVDDEEFEWNISVAQEEADEEDEEDEEEVAFYEDEELPEDTSIDMSEELQPPKDAERTPRQEDFITPHKRSNSLQAAFHRLAGPRYIGSPVVADSSQTPVRPRPLPGINVSSRAQSLSSLKPSNHTPQQWTELERASAREEHRSFLRALNAAKKSPVETPPPSEARAVRVLGFEVNVAEGSRLIPSQEGPVAIPTKFNDGDIRPVKRLRLVDKPTAIAKHLSAFSVACKSTPSPVVKRTFGTRCSRLLFHLARRRLTNAYTYAPTPPATIDLLSTLHNHGIAEIVYTDPHYSNELDASEKSWEFAGLLYHLKGGNGLAVLQGWQNGDTVRAGATTDDDRNIFLDTLDCTGVGGWEYASSPPSVHESRRWLAKEKVETIAQKKLESRTQIGGPTQHAFGLKESPKQETDAEARGRQNLSILSIEVFAPSPDGLVPDPDMDEIAAAFYSFQPDSGTQPTEYQTGIIAVQHPQLNQKRLRDFSFQVVRSELDLLNTVVDLTLDLDPDIVVGWEIQGLSWGYVSARGRQFGLDIGDQISRAPGRFLSDGNEQWGLRNTSTFHSTGRHALNVWRIMRSELSLGMYTFENTAFHLLQRRVPKYTAATLTDWFNSLIPMHTSQLMRYYSSRTTMVLEMLDAAETITKTAEFARVFGVDFFSVISRGSQFKVESFMFRIAKPESFVLLSPSRQDVGKQNAAECMPLIMEPLSAFYNSPLVVLDFQSLYPSIMIAYNYCYSTCLGRVTPFKGQYKLGVTEVKQPKGMVNTLQDYITVAPNGIMYVKKEVRKGLLGRMLTELLETRVMVKQAMKTVKDNKALKRVLHARQLGLKYIANVTYGYTSATYSGRMPIVEIADSIVQSGRETLEKAVKLIESTDKWSARVVYGDTDSLFIYLPGRTKDQAFKIGHNIADTVTRLNPSPVKLKFEKVYLPCVLMAKKRYVGFSYENPDEVKPIFDAKGIETVRRDGVPAQQKMVETALKMLFRSQDLSEIKEYCCRSWSKILEGKVAIQDFIFAREVKLGTYSDKVPPPPGVTVAARRIMLDPKDEPQYGERIPYVISRSEPGKRLVDRAVAPEEMLDSRLPRDARVDGVYYVSRVLIPPLQRVFQLVGVDPRSWYDEMPKTFRVDEKDGAETTPGKEQEEDMELKDNRPKIEEHFRSFQCFTCGGFTSEGICEECRMTPQEAITGLLHRKRGLEERLKKTHAVCTSCTSSAFSEPIRCESLDCSFLFRRKKAEAQMEEVAVLRELADGLVELMEDSDDEEWEEDMALSSLEPEEDETKSEVEATQMEDLAW